MGGAICVTCTETGRYSMFSASIAQLKRASDTEVYFAAGSGREFGRNALVQKMIDNDAQWLLFLDDDHTFEEDLLERLLARDLDIVGALYCRRDMPYTPIAYEARIPHGKYVPIDLTRYKMDELVKVDALGIGGMLIKRRVFDSLKSPWFERAEKTEDLLFCERAREKFEIYCDLGVRMGHMTTATICPGEGEHGEWVTQFNISGQVNFLSPVKR